VTEEKGPTDRLLDLLVFGPAGLAITAAEEFPKLVDKGRHRIEGQVQTARLVGRFAVQTGRRQVDQILRRLAATEHPAVRAAGRASPPPSHDAPPAPPAAPVLKVGRVVARDNGSEPGLAIPGYDTLSASQVVQRLGGLSRPELEEVRSHEAGHRHRRTILHRVDQLLAGVDGEQPQG
jgi:hypothetical protein